MFLQTAIKTDWWYFKHNKMAIKETWLLIFKNLQGFKITLEYILCIYYIKALTNKFFFLKKVVYKHSQ